MQFFKINLFLLLCIISSSILLAIPFNPNIIHQSKQLDDIVIATYNINAASNIDENYKKDLINVIDNISPDVLCVQEMSSIDFYKHFLFLDSIFEYNKNKVYSDTVLRYNLLSKKPLRNFRHYNCVGDIDTEGFSDSELKEYLLLKQRMPVYSAEIEIESGKWITVFSCHLRSNAYSTARRNMKEGSSWLSGIFSYYHNYRIGQKIRNYEARNVRKFIEEAHNSGYPVVVAGDLNDWLGSDCLDILIGSDDFILKDAWHEKGDGWGYTYHGWNLKLTLDHILYSNELDLEEVSICKSDLSDHYPLVAKFKLK